MVDSLSCGVVSWSDHIAYFCVHCRAVALYPSRSCLYCFAISGTSGSSGLGSHNNEQIDSNTFEIVNAGDQLLRNISRQIEPFEFIFGW